MRVTNDQIDKLTEICLDDSIRHGVAYQEVLAQFEVQIGMPLTDVRARMAFGEFDEAYQRFCRARGYKS